MMQTTTISPEQIGQWLGLAGRDTLACDGVRPPSREAALDRLYQLEERLGRLVGLGWQIGIVAFLVFGLVALFALPLVLAGYGVLWLVWLGARAYVDHQEELRHYVYADRVHATASGLALHFSDGWRHYDWPALRWIEPVRGGHRLAVGRHLATIGGDDAAERLGATAVQILDARRAGRGLVVGATARSLSHAGRVAEPRVIERGLSPADG